MKNIIIILILLLLAFAGYSLFRSSDSAEVTTAEENSEEDDTDTETPDGEEASEEEYQSETALGSSADGHAITAYHYGTGDTELLFVGGIHGGYSWGTTLVAYELMDYLEDNAEEVPDNVRVTVIPVMNPDGLNETVGTTGRFRAADVNASQDDVVAGRFNGNNVDLNRNFDCDWQSDGVWQSATVDAGDAPFSEPEAEAVHDYIMASDPAAAVVWYSAGGGVYASSCHEGVLPETSTLTNLYADASGYSAHESFDFYSITGDMVNWLAKEDIPAISVLLSTHGNAEWSKNRAGIEAVLEHYAE